MPADIYMDHNATSPVRPEVVDAVSRALVEGGNPSSVHKWGRRARMSVEKVRDRLAALMNASPDHVIFTSGGTEANALALKGAGRTRILASAVEHASVIESGVQVELIPVDGDGVIDLNALESLLSEKGEDTLVSVMIANNETGVIQPVSEVVKLARAAGALVHCDAVQGLGKLSLDMTGDDIDFMSVSAHKIGGPTGIGALAIQPGLKLMAVQQGGGQEKYRRSGTENVPGIVGFGAALEVLMTAQKEPLASLRDALETRIREIAPDARFFGQSVARLENTTCFAVPDIGSETQVMGMDLGGVMISAGSACSSGKVSASHVLAAMGVEDHLSSCAIRVSLGWTSTSGDIDRFTEVWGGLYRRKRGNQSTTSSTPRQTTAA